MSASVSQWTWYLFLQRPQYKPLNYRGVKINLTDICEALSSIPVTTFINHMQFHSLNMSKCFNDDEDHDKISFGSRNSSKKCEVANPRSAKLNPFVRRPMPSSKNYTSWRYQLFSERNIDWWCWFEGHKPLSDHANSPGFISPASNKWRLSSFCRRARSSRTNLLPWVIGLPSDMSCYFSSLAYNSMTTSIHQKIPIRPRKF